MEICSSGATGSSTRRVTPVPLRSPLRPQRHARELRFPRRSSVTQLGAAQGTLSYQYRESEVGAKFGSTRATEIITLPPKMIPSALYLASSLREQPALQTR